MARLRYPAPASICYNRCVGITSGDTGADRSEHNPGRMRLKDYDVIVVGAGPAGSSAARRAAEGGLRVLLVEKRQQVGFPVRCAEAVGRDGLHAELGNDPVFFPDGPDEGPAESYLADRIEAGELVSPGGRRAALQRPGSGYVLERKLFDLLLAEGAARAGAEVRVKTRLVGLEREGDSTDAPWRIELRGGSGVDAVRARVLIGADGVESTIRRRVGLGTAWGPGEVHSCAQVLAAGLGDRLRPSTVSFHLGSRVAPRGYAWVFPKGPGRANIGLGVRGDNRPLHAAAYLDRFLETNYPGAAILERVHGCVPSVPPPSRLVGDGVLLVGDAAGQVDPFSGAGINWALESGRLAGETVARTLEAGHRPTRQSLRGYEEDWQQRHRREHLKLSKVKGFVDALSDEELDGAVTAVAEAAAGGELGEFSVARLLRQVLRHAPGLLWKARKLL